MSNIAIDPVTKNVLTVEEWLINCSNRKGGICPICNEDIFLKADTSISTSTHFSHYPKSNCPTIIKNRVNYLHLPVSGLDKSNGEIIKQQVIKNSFYIYSKCTALAEGLVPYEFSELIEKADENNIWDYKGLTLKYV